jgi:hypothetical protein
MDEDKRVPGAMRNKRGRDNRLSKCGCGGKDAVVVSHKSVENPRLRLSQFPLERGAIGKQCADFATIIQDGNRIVTIDELDCFVETASG